MQTPDCFFCNSFLGAIRGGTRVCSSLTSLRVRGPGWFCLWALDLVEVRGSRAGGEMSISRGCSMSLVVPAEGCFRIVFDSAGSAGVMSGPTLVVGRGITLFRCFVVLCSRVVCFHILGVPTALAGKGLVIPTEPCSRGSPPTLFR
ncbi:hypothetical protein Taro_023488 [Colocasia esculenta]|uniref:Uncharacterized protein n=1 Tax=Colocasia esculenta TaxID=4460 RepID=A0A843UXJ7_COLES|nr:hypothetical protein [Colocasia esculenta]